jgi:hypothetical protein
MKTVVAMLIALVASAAPAAAQQRPLVTEDPEPIGAGRVLIEGGIDAEHDAQEPAYGLKGNLWRIPTIGISVGISSIAEFQIDGAPYQRLSVTQRTPAPLTGLLTFTGDSTRDVEDIVIGTKIRVLAENAGRPAVAFRFATKLPDASNQSGLGLDTTDFFASLLLAKTVQSVRFVGNVGVGILAEPTNATSQNDVLTYGVSFARAMTDRAEIVGEVNGRWSVRNGPPPVGTESRSILKLGGRYTHGPVRFDGGVYFGLTTVDPTVGVTAGFTYVFNAFTLP